MVRKCISRSVNNGQMVDIEIQNLTRGKNYDLERNGRRQPEVHMYGTVQNAYVQDFQL